MMPITRRRKRRLFPITETKDSTALLFWFIVHILQTNIGTNVRFIIIFSSAGVGEAYLAQVGIDVIVANELLQKRADLHVKLYPKCKTICGDITNPDVFHEIMDAAKGIEFLLASPPCQGMSIAGKNRHQETMVNDKRNHLINYVFDAIETLCPKYVLIENVKQLLQIKLPYEGKLHSVVEILEQKFGNRYTIDGKVAFCIQ